ncbi:MAG TPA: hypothetical protein VK152_12615 [Paludibacter sp.]|nr:hypothetical protein [Paludibacter sp.]
MKRVLTLFVVVLVTGIAVSQNFKQVRVTLENGLVVKGSNAFIGDESVTLTMGGQAKTYSLSDVSFIQAKQGRGGSWALGCGAGCLAVCVVSGIISSENNGFESTGSSMPQYILGSLLWAGASAGIGYLIGSLSDREEIVYHKTGSRVGSLNFNIQRDRLTKFDPPATSLTLAYKF